MDEVSHVNPKDSNGLNLYCYCGNNPIMYVDTSGNKWYNVLAWIGVGLVAVVLTVLTLGAFGIALAGAVIGGFHGLSTAKVHSVYVSKSNGTVNYVGRTNNIARRTSEHSLGKRGIVPQEVANKLTLKQARGLERALIEKYGLIKNGGTLINKINSIAFSNPIYHRALAWGNKYIIKYLPFL